MGESIQIVYYLSMLTLGGALGYLLSQQMKKNALSQLEQEAEQRAQRRLAEEERAQRLQLLEEKDHWYKQRTEQERALEGQVQEMGQREKQLASRGRELNNQREELQKEWTRLRTHEKRLALQEGTNKEMEAEVQRTLGSYRQKLELTANLTAEEAREQLLEHLAGEVRARSAALIRA